MKHWRRRGTRGPPSVFLLLEDLGGGFQLATCSPGLLAVPGAASVWWYRINGGAWQEADTEAWPWPTEVFNIEAFPEQQMEVRVVIDGGFEVVSNAIMLPA